MTRSMQKELPKKNILGIGITDATEQEILEYIINSIENFTNKYYISTPNPEMIVASSRQKAFKTLLNDATLALCDGTGVILAAKILGKPLKARVTGTDLLLSLCKAVSNRPVTVGFLGAGPKVAESAAECLRQKYPNLSVSFIGRDISDFAVGPAVAIPRPTSSLTSFTAGARRGSPGHVTHSEPVHSQNTKYQIPDTDILFVAYGFPKQEKFMAENLEKLPVKIMMGVGGAFDYISGRVPRAPKFIREIGLEWLFRLVVQPWRIKRQFALLEFLLLVTKEKLKATVI